MDDSRDRYQGRLQVYTLDENANTIVGRCRMAGPPTMGLQCMAHIVSSQLAARSWPPPVLPAGVLSTGQLPPR
jgi:hypothetical protein